MVSPLTTIGGAALERIRTAKTVGETVHTRQQPIETQAAFVQAIRRLAGAALGFVVVILLMIQLWSMEMVTSANGPWADLLTQVKTVLMASFGLIALALFAYAANIAMSALNFGNGGGNR
jgi:tetrahydromethanopterin S-methyltransferase subunit F